MTKFEDLFTADHDSFLESMADADSAVMDYLGTRNMVYVNVANCLSVDCDCDAHPHDPEMAVLGIFASLDPAAIDQACVDAVYNSPDPGKASLIERMESRNHFLFVENHPFKFLSIRRMHSRCGLQSAVPAASVIPETTRR